ncbi:MAG: ATP-binding protein [Eubacteriales bacterium]
MLLLTTLISETLRSNDMNEKMSELKSVVADINLAFEQDSYSITGEAAYYDIIKEAAEKNDAVIWLSDTSMNIRTIVDGSGNITITNTPMNSELASIAQQVGQGNTISAVSTLENVFGTSVILVAAPLIIENKYAGAIFMYSELRELDKSLSAVFSQIFNCVLFSLAISIFVAFIFSRYFSRDIRKITTSANRLSGGDFSTRVYIKSQTEIGNLADTFNNMAGELERQEKLKTTFVADVSHELRTPMTSIQGFVQGIIDGAISKDDQETYLKTVLSEIKRLNSLIADLLEMSRLDSPELKLNIEHFDINELLRRSIINFEQAIESKKINVEIGFGDKPNMVLADPDKIAQVATNIIDNAVKFTPKGGKISINVKRSADKTNVIISDTGIGIPENELPFIFERFYKVDKARAEYKGTGLGLAIVKRIIEQHGEKISVDSKEGKGTKFTFTLPNKTTNKNVFASH